MRRLILLLIAVITVLALTACSPSHDFEGGHPISREDLESMSEALFDTEAPTEDETSPPGIVYWTDSGSVYHRDPNCRHLTKAEKVKSGYIGNAEMYGKDRPCSVCGEP